MDIVIVALNNWLFWNTFNVHLSSLPRSRPPLKLDIYQSMSYEVKLVEIAIWIIVILTRWKGNIADGWCTLFLLITIPFLYQAWEAGGTKEDIESGGAGGEEI